MLITRIEFVRNDSTYYYIIYVHFFSVFKFNCRLQVLFISSRPHNIIIRGDGVNKSFAKLYFHFNIKSLLLPNCTYSNRTNVCGTRTRIHIQYNIMRVRMTRLFPVLLCLLYYTSCYNNIHGQRGVEKLFNSLLPAVERGYHYYYNIMWQKDVGKMVGKKKRLLCRTSHNTGVHAIGS